MARRGRRRRAGAVLAAALAQALCACSPTFDWREISAEGSGLVTSFPCRPDHHSRVVGVAGVTVRMDMLVCSAGGATYAVSYFDAADPNAVDTGLKALRTAMLSNVQAFAPRQRPFAIPGLGPAMVRLSAGGRQPDGGALHLEAAFFSSQLRVYQAAVVGPPLSDEVVDPFFEGLRLPE